MVNSTNAANLANMANLAIFRQRPKCNRMSSRHGYEQSSEFDEYGEFGKCGEFDYILPKTKYNRMSSRQGYQQSGEFDEYGEFGKYANLTIFCKRPKMHGSERAQDKGNNKAANSTNAAIFFFLL